MMLMDVAFTCCGSGSCQKFWPPNPCEVMSPRVMWECVLRDVSCDRCRCRITDVILMWFRPQVNVRVILALDFCDPTFVMSPLCDNVTGCQHVIVLIRLMWWRCLSVTMWIFPRSHFLYRRFAARRQGRRSILTVIWSAGVGHMFQIWSMFRDVLSTMLIFVSLLFRSSWGAQPSLGHGPKGVILTKSFHIVFSIDVVMGFSTLPFFRKM